MWGMPPSVRRIVAENAAALADEGIAVASSAITALGTTTDVIKRSRRRSSAAAQLLIGSPSQSNGSGNGRTRGTIPARAIFVQLAARQATERATADSARRC